MAGPCRPLLSVGSADRAAAEVITATGTTIADGGLTPVSFCRPVETEVGRHTRRLSRHCGGRFVRCTRELWVVSPRGLTVLSHSCYPAVPNNDAQR